MDNLNTISDLLKRDGVILCPTDTIWGLGCSAESSIAAEKIYQIKERDRNKTFIVLFDSIERAKSYIIDLHPRIENFLSFYKKPLTIIHKASDRVPAYLQSERKEVAIRICQHTLIARLIKDHDLPLISTSANKQGEPTPSTFPEIPDKIKNEVDYIFHSDREVNGHASASRIIRYDGEGELFFLR